MGNKYVMHMYVCMYINIHWIIKNTLIAIHGWHRCLHGWLNSDWKQTMDMPWILIVGVRWISLTSLYYYTMHWPEMCEVKLDENKGFDPKRKGWMKQTMDLQAAKNRLRTRLEWKQHQCKFRTRGKQHQWSLKYKVSGSKQIMWLTQSTYFPGKMFQHKFNHTLKIGGKQ